MFEFDVYNYKVPTLKKEGAPLVIRAATSILLSYTESVTFTATWRAQRTHCTSLIYRLTSPLDRLSMSVSYPAILPRALISIEASHGHRSVVITVDHYHEWLQRLLIGPTNRHKSFRRVSLSLTHCMRNFLGSHSNFSTRNALNCEVLKSELLGKKGGPLVNSYQCNTLNCDLKGLNWRFISTKLHLFF